MIYLRYNKAKGIINMNLQTIDLDEMESKFVGFVKTQLNMVKGGFMSEEMAGALITGYFDGMHAMVTMSGKMYDLLDLSSEALYSDTFQKEIAIKYFE